MDTTPAICTQEDIQLILSLPDPIERNRRVTRAYRELAVSVFRRHGGPDLTWCAFATWASATAGRMIAMEEVPGAVRAHLDASPGYRRARTHVGELLDHSDVLHAIDEVATQVAGSVSAGNSLVFAELAPPFAALAAGHAMPDGLADPVAEAFDRYRRAFAETDPVRRAQGVLGANVMAVAHEQERLQGFVASAIDACVTDGVRAVVTRRFLGRVVEELDGVLAPLAREVERAWNAEMTAHMMTLVVAGHAFDLGRDVPPLAGGATAPPALRDLASPDPAELVARFDRTGGTLVGSAARDWTVLSDRMNYIVNLFRSRQQDLTVLDAPIR